MAIFPESVPYPFRRHDPIAFPIPLVLRPLQPDTEEAPIPLVHPGVPLDALVATVPVVVGTQEKGCPGVKSLPGTDSTPDLY
jgi:hypothetical protein